MILDSFLKLLSDHPDTEIQFALPKRGFVPAHFHVTEVGQVRKDFIDCGGTLRSESACTMQIWVANDVDHRLNTTKLARIFESAAPLLKSRDLPVEVEYDQETVGLFSVADAVVSPTAVVLNLQAKHTTCLAPDRCGLNILTVSDCGPTGCC